MEVRIWDTGKKYTKGILREYTHWMLELSYRQHTPGSYIIFAKRSLEHFSELNSEELDELTVVMKDMEGALESIEALKPDRFNYLQLGNALHHLHFHCIPRYAAPRTFAGRTWTDTTFGNVPAWSHTDEPEEYIAQLRDTIKPYLK